MKDTTKNKEISLKTKLSIEEKAISLCCDINRECWQAISFKSFEDFFLKVDSFENFKNSEQCFNKEKLTYFFLELFDLILRSRLLNFNRDTFCDLKRRLYKKGVYGLLKDKDYLIFLDLNYCDKFGELFNFSPGKILNKILFGKLHEFTSLIGLLTNENYPQETNLHKWIVFFRDNFYEKGI